MKDKRYLDAIARVGIAVNTVYNEDCLATMRRIAADSIDLTVTSPPYDDMREYSGYAFDQFEAIALELYRITAEGGVVVWVIGDATKNGNESGTSFRHALYFRDEAGFRLFDTMIYQKPPRGAFGNNKTYWQSFEYMFVLSKGHPKTINLICDRENKEERDGDTGSKRLANGELLTLKRGGYGKKGRRTNIWQYRVGKGHSARDNFAHEHPAIFPEGLARDHILSWSNPHDIIYDPFMGSGTTAKMALMSNRYWLGSEVSKNYCEIAEKRVAHMLASPIGRYSSI